MICSPPTAAKRAHKCYTPTRGPGERFGYCTAKEGCESKSFVLVAYFVFLQCGEGAKDHTF